ncbi:ferritin-like domain-containing protein [Chitinophaga sp. SYP-B3965]|uniref:ferritin-like domain-containing protein n=1 Tax=Chitinophaga sp. SYP-B3965 TaxID=2663120 RepID=UPI001299DAEA|nr:ferritin-like domain-containing protein [Chitinophaga sp. SYP-B3965]MRG43990.1 ferritin-like domain-containing protein [Chitinophaga sp. SYP-B3965]
MNIHHIITELEKADPEVYERLDSRRGVMKSFAKMSGKLALAALPLALGGMFKKAYGQSTTTILGVLQFALKLEYLEAEFYTMGAAAPALVPAGAPMGAITTIRDHENAHVKLLKDTIVALAGTPEAKPVFDFSAGNGSGNGPLKTVFTDYALFLAVAQTFEDTGVRAYKGQAANLMSNNDVLTAALNIHSVEARHASHIRSMRRVNLSNPAIKPWITGKDTGGIGALVQASYDGEEVTTQATINIVNINGQAISVNAATEAFDEPLTSAQVLAIVDPFIV